MATKVITARNTRQDSMDTTANINNIGGGAGAGVEPDFIYQGAASISRKISTTLAGFYANTVPAHTFNNEIWLAKVIATNKDALLAVGSPAMELRAGSGPSNYYSWDVHGNETYPAKGGWIIWPIDPTIAAYQSNLTGGTATPGQVWGLVADFSATSKAENLAMDAIDIGTGLCVVGGTGTDPQAEFQDFLDFDEGDITNGRFGYWTQNEGIFYVFGRHAIGQNSSQVASATEFSDSNKTLVFPDGLFGVSAAGLFVDLSNAGTVIEWNSCNFIGRGNQERLRFDTETEVDGTNDEITNPDVIAAFVPGDCVTFSSLQGTESIGVSLLSTTYYVGKDLTATPTGISLHADRHDAMLESGSPGSGTKVNLTASTAGNGEKWEIRKQIRTTPSLTGAATVNGTLTMNGCSFANWQQVGSSNTFGTANDCTFRGTKSLELEVLDGCVVADSKTTPLESLWSGTGTQAENLTNTEFVQGQGGHALQITSNGGSFNLSGLTFTGYGPTEQGFNTETAVNGTLNTVNIPGHGYASGDQVVYIRKTGDTESIGLTSNSVYAVRAVDANTLAFYLNPGDAINDNSRISLTASGAGNGETHYVESADAAIYYSGTGALTLNISGGGNVPSIRATAGGSVTVVLAYTLTIIVKDNLGNLLENIEVTVVKTSDTSELYHLENTPASGQAVYSYDASLAGTDVDILFMSVNYKPDISDIKNLLLPAQSQTINVTLFPDENYSNPA